MFGAAASQNQGGTGLFGSLGAQNQNQNQNQQSGTGLFGSLGQNQNQQPSGSVFGGQPQNQQGTGLFGSLGNNQQNQNQNQNQQGRTGLFGSLGQNQNQQPSGSVFGGQPQNQQGTGLFGSLGNNQQNQQKPSIFGQPQQTGGSTFGSSLLPSGLGGSLLQSKPAEQGASLWGIPPQQQGNPFGQSQQPQQNTLFGQTQQQPQQLPQLGQSQLNNSLWQPNSSINPREKSVQDQMATVLQKWDTGNPNCAFKYYFYNKVGEATAPFYRPPPGEDSKAWEEALSEKPGPGYIPVLCSGFAQMGERITTQQRHLASFNEKLHEINRALSTMLQNHDTKTSIRAIDARRRHLVLKQRCLALATKVQILRNRGYAMNGDEEDLKTKLQTLERGAYDPGLDAKGEEIWARMITVQERAKLLRHNIEKDGGEQVEILDEDMSNRAKKILEDYQTQLLHLKKELDSIQKDYVEWEKDQPQNVKDHISKAQNVKVNVNGQSINGR
ncbi:hypothetical protein B7494_g5062 [Chlorociboria aeruginascens]|nr:hypothetical protein B7494_g5062 [Chlorociboria aeruginascens]